MSINLKWRRDGGDHEVLGAVHGSVEIEVEINNTGKVERASYRQLHKGQRRHGAWSIVQRHRPLWNDLQAAVLSFQRQRHKVS